ncbi:MAG: hypothetical protein PHO70_01080 [Candidatus Omnitrophica bacterium]|nr:hypothetical protein [Candidatus Omnitrophota bacterium]
MRRLRRGQSTIEYFLIMVAFILALLVSNFIYRLHNPTGSGIFDRYFVNPSSRIAGSIGAMHLFH